MPKKINKKSDAPGITQLVEDATLGITDLVEALHRQILHPPMLPSTPLQDLLQSLAGITYTQIRQGTRLISGGLDAVLGHLTPLLSKLGAGPERDTLISVLNGVVGDYLEQNANRLAIEMHLRYQFAPVPLDRDRLLAVYPRINGHILVLVHGSCLNDLHWTRNGHSHGAALAEELGQTPIYLRYNSGRHISHNGKSLSALLEELVRHWPVPIEQLTILGHSMGGLVTRSAVHYGQQDQKSWTKYLEKMVFLGTPHHGARLERFGNFLDVVLASIPYARPFARLGKIRSAGVTDLRYGNLVDEDWQGRDRFARLGDKRTFIPLPQSTACYSIAGTVGKGEDPDSALQGGDRLVDVRSAFGQHKDSAKDLNFKEAHTWVAFETSHLDLLGSPEVYAKLKSWLA
ncbi:MAG: alpha/beta hydrolase [Bacteroidota bacterium]